MNEVLNIISNHTNPQIAADKIKLDDELACLGIDSLKFLLLILDLDEHAKTGIFTPEIIPEIKTVNDIMDRLQNEQLT